MQESEEVHRLRCPDLGPRWGGECNTESLLSWALTPVINHRALMASRMHPLSPGGAHPEGPPPNPVEDLLGCTSPGEATQWWRHTATPLASSHTSAPLSPPIPTRFTQMCAQAPRGDLAVPGGGEELPAVHPQEAGAHGQDAEQQMRPGEG